jgi:hypothetical protein
MRLKERTIVTNPSHQTDVEGGMYVTHKPIKLAVTLGRPTRDLARKVSDGSQKVKTRHPRGVETLH